LQEAAAAAAAAVAATRNDDQLIPLAEDDDAELAEDVLEGLRKLDTGSNRVTWYVYSDTPGRSGNSEGYIEKLRTEHLDEARFKSRYGPGEYRVFGRSSDGHYVKGSHKTIRISDIGAEPGTLNGQSTDALALLREMRQADEQRAAKRSEEVKSYATILATPLATLGAALIARRPALDIPALIAALRPQQSTLTEVTTALANLRQLSGSDSSLDVVLKVIDKLQDLPTGQSGETGWFGFLRDIVKEAAPHAREVLTQLAQQRSGALPGQLPVGATTGPAFGPGVQSLPPAPSAPVSIPSSPLSGGASKPVSSSPTPTATQSVSQSPSEGADMWTMIEPWLRRKAEDLHEAASSNIPVELVAEMLLTQAEKKFGFVITPAELTEVLSRPDWWQHVVTFYPALEPYQAYCSDLRQEILGMLEEDSNKTQQGTEQHD
jgi:hypothetical protein